MSHTHASMYPGCFQTLTASFTWCVDRSNCNKPSRSSIVRRTVHNYDKATDGNAEGKSNEINEGFSFRMVMSAMSSCLKIIIRDIPHSTHNFVDTVFRTEWMCLPLTLSACPKMQQLTLPNPSKLASHNHAFARCGDQRACVSSPRPQRDWRRLKTFFAH